MFYLLYIHLTALNTASSKKNTKKAATQNEIIESHSEKNIISMVFTRTASIGGEN